VAGNLGRSWRTASIDGNLIGARDALILVHRRWPAALEAAIFLVALVPLWLAPVLPLIDFYNHLARFFVLAHIAGDKLLQTGYRAHWSLLPNIGVDVIAVPILRFVPPLIAAKVIVAGILATMYSGVLYFHRALTGNRSLLVAILLSPLLYSYILNWGFANFIFGLSLAFWAAGWWLRHRQKPWRAVPWACFWAFGIFLAHGLAFALYGILTISLEVGLFLARSERRFADLLRSLAPLAVQAILPTILFLIWKIGEGRHLVEKAAWSSHVPAAAPIVHNGLHRLSTVLRVEEGPAYWFDAVTFFAQVALVLLLILRGKSVITRVAWPLVVVAVAMVAAVPSQIFDVFYVSDRMPLFAALCVLGALDNRSTKWTKLDWMSGSLLCAIAAGRIAAVAIGWHAETALYAEFQAVAAKIPPGAVTLEVMAGSGHHETTVLRCPVYGPLLVALHKDLTPLFADPDQQPLLLVGKLGQAQQRLDRITPLPDERVRDFNPYMTEAADAGYQYLLVCNRQLITKPFSSRFRLRSETAHFALLEPSY
jgi:hypothetical protein